MRQYMQPVPPLDYRSSALNSTSAADVKADDFVLQARGLTKAFGGLIAVDGVDLNVRRHTIHALIGPNGAGKTTCFNLLTKFARPTSGSILFNGVDVTRESPENIAGHGVVRSFQISAIFQHLTPVENIRIALQRKLRTSFHFWRSVSSLHHLNHRAEELLDEVGLLEGRNLPAGALPYGRKRALEIATTLALDPQVLLLDEPLAGMGREDIGAVAALIRRVAVGRTVLMVEHNLRVVASLSDTITVLCRGQVLCEGSYATVSKNPEVISAYMGSGHA